MGAAEAWRQRAGPWVRAILPDEQQLDVTITAWRRAGDGRWWAEVEAILPARADYPGGRSELVGVPTAISVPAEQVTPIPGEEYSAVPRDGAVAGRQWVVEPLRSYGGDGPARRVHRRDCWQARDSHARITAREAAEALGQGAAESCEVCRPDRALRRS